MILNKNKNYFMRHVFLLFQKVFIIVILWKYVSLERK